MLAVLYTVALASAADSLFYVSADAHLYMHNLEYRTALLEGRSILGGHAQLRMGLRPAAPFRIHVGVHGRREMGDSRFASDARLLVSGSVYAGPATVTLGELDSRFRHHLPEALRSRQRQATLGFEEGVQILLDLSHFQQDLWIDWRALNTPSHREHFIAGSVSRFTWRSLTVPLAVVVDHYGGEQYAVEGDPVRQNIAGGGGAVVTFELPNRLSEVGGELRGFGSVTEADRSEDAYRAGGGVRAAAWIRPFDVLVRFAFYRGEGFVCWEGDPLYRTGRPWYSLTVAYQYEHRCGLALDTGLRLDCVDVAPLEYFDSAQHRIWLCLRYRLGERYMRRGNRD